MKEHNEHDDSIDRLLRAAFDVPDPSEADLARAESAFRSRIEAAPREPDRALGLLRRMPRLAVVSVVVAVIVAVVGVQLSRPAPAVAALGEIAEAAGLVMPLTVPSQSYAYTASEAVVLVVIPAERIGDSDGRLAYLLPQTREVWRGDAGTVQIRTTIGTPRFFDQALVVRYYAAGIDREDQVGQTRIETVGETSGILEERRWPTSAEDLERLLVSMSGEPVGRLQIALALIRETAAPPELRAATLEVIAHVEGLELVEERGDEYFFGFDTITSDGRTRYAFTLSGSGTLVEESETLVDGFENLGIPPGTVISHTTYGPTVIVDALPACTDCN